MSRRGTSDPKTEYDLGSDGKLLWRGKLCTHCKMEEATEDEPLCGKCERLRVAMSFFI
jgi:hypothetical protein